MLPCRASLDLCSAKDSKTTNKKYCWPVSLFYSHLWPLATATPWDSEGHCPVDMMLSQKRHSLFPLQFCPPPSWVYAGLTSKESLLGRPASLGE